MTNKKSKNILINTFKMNKLKIKAKELGLKQKNQFMSHLIL